MKNSDKEVQHLKKMPDLEVVERNLQELEEALPGINLRQSFVDVVKGLDTGAREVDVQLSIGYQIVVFLPLTWQIIGTASLHGFSKEFIVDFATQGLVDEDLPYSPQDLAFLPPSFVKKYTVHQDRYLALPFEEKQHRVLSMSDVVPFFGERRGFHCVNSGSYASVYKVREGDKVFACKEISKAKVGEEERTLLAEILPKEASHLLKLRASYLKAGKIHLIIYPWVDLNLQQFITGKEGFLWWKQLKEDGSATQTLAGWMSCIAAALANLHCFKVKHMDLKPDNIGLAFEDDKKIVPYLLDYGCSRFFLEDSQAVESSGCTYYASPEKQKGRPEGRKGDVFSLGIVFFELSCVLSSGASCRFNKIMRMKGDENHRWARIAEERIHDEVLALLPSADRFWVVFVPLLRRMLDYDPINRPSAKQVWEELKQVQESLEWPIHCFEKIRTPSPNRLASVKEGS